MNIKSRAIEGAFWNVFFAVANKIITAVGQFALAWFLLPSDMGWANLAQSMAAFTAILSVGGLGDVLLQRRKFDQEAGQAFWLSLLFSIFTALIIGSMALASPFIGKPKIENLLWFLSLATLIGAPATIMAASLKNKLDYKGLAISQFIGGLFFTPAAVFLAWLGWGPYALIVPLISKQLATMVVMFVRGGVFNFVKPIWSKLKKLLKPTFALSISGLFAGLQTQAPIFVCGMVLGAEQTGFFSWGWMVAGQVVFLLATNLREVLLPTFTKIGNDPERMAKAALKTGRAMTAFLCVTCGAQALLCDGLIRMFLPAKWYPAIPLVILFSLGLVSQGFWVSGSAFLNASGKYRQLVLLNAVQVGLTAGITWIGSIVGGVWGASIGCAIAVFAGGSIYIWFINRNISEGRSASWWAPSFITIFMWLVCFFISWKQGFGIQIVSAVLFIGFNSWIWWRFDDGGLKLVIDKLSRKLLMPKRVGG